MINFFQDYPNLSNDLMNSHEFSWILMMFDSSPPVFHGDAARPFSWVLTLSASKATTQLCTLWHPGGKSGSPEMWDWRNWTIRNVDFTRNQWWFNGFLLFDQQKKWDLSNCAGGISCSNRPSPGRWGSSGIHHIQVGRKIGNAKPNGLSSSLLFWISPILDNPVRDHQNHQPNCKDLPEKKLFNFTKHLPTTFRQS